LKHSGGIRARRRVVVARPEKTRQGLKLALALGEIVVEDVARPEKTRQGLKPSSRSPETLLSRCVARPEKTRQGLKLTLSVPSAPIRGRVARPEKTRQGLKPVQARI